MQARRVVAGLGDDLAPQPFALDLDEHPAPARVERHQVERTAVEPQLPRDDDEPAFEQRGVAFNPVFEIAFLVQCGEREARGAVVRDLPETDGVHVRRRGR